LLLAGGSSRTRGGRRLAAANQLVGGRDVDRRPETSAQRAEMSNARRAEMSIAGSTAGVDLRRQSDSQWSLSSSGDRRRTRGRRRHGTEEDSVGDPRSARHSRKTAATQHSRRASEQRTTDDGLRTNSETRFLQTRSSTTRLASNITEAETNLLALQNLARAQPSAPRHKDFFTPATEQRAKEGRA